MGDYNICLDMSKYSKFLPNERLADFIDNVKYNSLVLRFDLSCLCSEKANSGFNADIPTMFFIIKKMLRKRSNIGMMFAHYNEISFSMSMCDKDNRRYSIADIDNIIEDIRRDIREYALLSETVDIPCTPLIIKRGDIIDYFVKRQDFSVRYNILRVIDREKMCLPYRALDNISLDMLPSMKYGLYSMRFTIDGVERYFLDDSVVHPYLASRADGCNTNSWPLYMMPVYLDTASNGKLFNK